MVLDNTIQIFSAKKVSDYLKNLGYKSSVDSVATYIKALEDSKIIYPAQRYDIKCKKVMQRLDKYYICDLGLRYAQQGYRDNDIAQMLENVVYMELKSRGYKVFVGKEKDKEVDFIAEKFDERQYYQVTYLLATKEVMEREYGSLKSIKDAYPKTVLSMDRISIGVDDEIPQFDKRTLDALRQPMEDGTVTISRVDQTNEYPSRFMLVAAMNPCPCGYYGEERCNCNAQMDSYLINEFCELDQECKDILRKSYKRFKFSAISYNKYLKVARTFADFENHENIQKNDLLNALTSRDMEK